MKPKEAEHIVTHKNPSWIKEEKVTLDVTPTNCLNMCFSSSVVFNPIDFHGTEAYIKSKYIIKWFGKEEWAWTSQSQTYFAELVFSNLKESVPILAIEIMDTAIQLCWQSMQSVCPCAYLSNATTAPMFFLPPYSSLEDFMEANQSSKEKKPPSDLTRTHLLHRIPATDCVLQQYLLGHLQFLLCRLELITILHHFKVGWG